jgi:hypothetical protein
VALDLYVDSKCSHWGFSFCMKATKRRFWRRVGGRRPVLGRLVKAPTAGHALPRSLCENAGWRAVAALYERRSASFRDPAVIDRRYK